MRLGEIPRSLLRESLPAGGRDAPDLLIEPVGNSHFAVVARVRRGDESYLAKYLPPGSGEGAAVLESEAAGLVVLGGVESDLTIPRIVTLRRDGRGALLVTGWLDSVPAGPRHAARLGEGLAQIHQHLGERYGWREDNFLGTTPQSNRWNDSWPAFFAGRRLAPLAQRLVDAGRLRGERAWRLERLMGRLEILLPHDPPPSLLHGDLWSGNWMALPAGGAALIDPAVHFGDRECDLAMMHLFGGFPARVFEAYEAAWPLPPGAAGRRPIYQLYHLLNHLLLFGEGYGSAVDRVLERAAGAIGG